MFILSQILVCVADLFYVISMLNKKKNGLVFYLIISDILFAGHYLCLGGFTGAATIFVDVAYLAIMYILEKKDKTKYNAHVTVGAMIITIILSILTWDTALSLLPMFSMLIYLATMIFSNVVIVKTGALVRNTLNVIYMLILTSYFGAGLEVCLMISAIIGIILNMRAKKKTEANIN
jgi:hypothetical protein